MLEDEVAELRKQVAALTAAVRRLTPRDSAWIPPDATVGSDHKLAGTVSLICRAETPIHIGNGVKIYRNAEILGPVTIGDRCMLNRDAYIRPQTTIGNDVYLGPFVRLVTDGHEMGSGKKRAGSNKVLPIVIGDGTWIGAGSTVLGGVTIGEGCMVAAGSLVNKDVPPNSLVGGVPARVIRSLA